VGRFLILLTILTLGIVACGEAAPQQSPRVQITTAPVVTSTPRPAQPAATNSPVPSPLPTWTLEAWQEATPRQVSVSRVSDSVDPTQNLLIQPGQPAPPVVLTDIDGNTYQLDTLQGRAVIINFWTVGCGSCFYEFPLLQEVRDELSTDDVLILAVNVSDLAEETRILAANLGATYPMVVDPGAEIFVNFFGGAVVPTTYFIAPDGTVQETLVGPMDRGVLRSMLAQSGIELAG
jgi:thiol-disulfide isomerase/thioredoxin